MDERAAWRRHGKDAEEQDAQGYPGAGHRHSHGLRHSLPGHEGRLRRELGA